MGRRRWDAQSSEDRINECLEAIERNTKTLYSLPDRNDPDKVRYAQDQINYYFEVIKAVYDAKFKGKF